MRCFVYNNKIEIMIEIGFDNLVRKNDAVLRRDYMTALLNQSRLTKLGKDEITLMVDLLLRNNVDTEIQVHGQGREASNKFLMMAEKKLDKNFEKNSQMFDSFQKHPPEIIAAGLFLFRIDNVQFVIVLRVLFHIIIPMDNLIDSHYLQLPSQGNIYLSAKVQKADGSNRIFVGCLRRKVYVVEYRCNDEFLEPITTEVYFAYISPGSEITSIDVFNRSKTIDDFVIGIVIMRNTETGTSAHLNLYCEYDLEPDVELNLETIGQHCESLMLEYIPYGLHHAQISPHQVNGSYENLWLLPGNDNKIHAYRGCYHDRSFVEIPVGNFFIEFEDVPGIVMCIKVLYYNNYHNRISSLGCESGYVRCAVVECKSNQILRILSTEYENPISSVQLFTLRMPEIPVEDIEQYIQNDDLTFLEKTPEINLLVTNTLFHSEVFMDVLKNDFKNRHCLHESILYDVCLCSVIADVDFDGNKEIILGTYGEELLLFKYIDNETWKFVGQKSIPNPVHRLFYVDLTEDGVNELVTVTAKGLHVYQHKLKDVYKLISSRIEKLDGQRLDELISKKDPS